MTRETLQSEILDTLGQRVVDGVYPPGRVVRSEDWAAEFDVSRTVIRETAKVLQSMRLISMQRSVGITVRPPHEWNVFDPLIIRWRLAGPRRDEQFRSLTELRLSIEPVAARNAAKQADVAVREAVLHHAQELEAAGLREDLDAVQFHDSAFHTLILSTSGNEMFAALSGVVTEMLRMNAHIVHDVIPEQQTSPPQHLHTVAARAIAAGDPEGAEHAMRSLLLEVDAQMAAVVGLTEGVPASTAGTASTLAADERDPVAAPIEPGRRERP